jgi:prevent-host-death family protein
MINLDNIHSLSDFKRNASNYVDQVRDSRSPIVLTVNGKAAVVVQDASAFQELLNHCQAMETELREMKMVALRKDLQVGIDQLEAGDCTAYTEESLDAFFEDIKRDGRRGLGISA